jgi:predicted outer membrane repeat protein
MKNVLLFSIAIFGISISNFAQNRLYVHSNAMGMNNGQSWADAYPDLNIALAAAQPGDSIWVAEGTYVPTTGNDRTISFVQKSGVRLYGGFEGTETHLDQRNLPFNPTVLSGDIGISGDSTDNAFTILYMKNPDSLTVLDGFFFRHGIANYTPTDQPATSAYKCGGALYIMAADGWAYPLIKNCHFEHNYAYSHGGAVYANGSGTGSVAPQFINCSFEHNRARLDGGALYRNGGSWVERSPDFGNCLFKSNIAERRGGGLCYNESERTDWIDLQGCDFLHNQSGLNGGGLHLNVGRVTGTNIFVKGCRFEGNGNDSGTSQGEVFSLSSFMLLDMGTLKIDSCSFIENDSGDIFFADVLGNSQVKIAKSIANSQNWGRDFKLNDFAVSEIIQSTLTNTFISVDKQFNFSMNVIKKSAIELYQGTMANMSNNFYLEHISSRFFANSQIFFDNNTMVEGNGDFFVGRNSVLNFYNSILNETENIKVSTASGPAPQILFDHCLFNAISMCESLSQYVTCGPNNLFNLDPQFRDPANGDYSLLPCSPLINAGSNAAAAGLLTDLAGNPRIQDGTVDIGAFESPAFSLAAEPVVKPACVGESNGSISISPVFGCEPYTYNWSPQAGTGPELSGLPPGSYLLTLTDGSGRQLLDTVQVNTASLPELNASSTDVDCTIGLGGSITALVSNGTAPYHYQWLPTAADTAYLTQLPPGNYSLTVTDINGCRDSASSNIALQGLLSLMVDGQIIRCFGETGWLSATPVTGLAPFSWAWTGWPGTDAVAEPLGPGNYSVTVTDTYGCTSSKTFPPMTEPGLLTVGTGSSDQTQTNPPNGAAVVTTISGGTGPFGYQWDIGSTEQAIAGLLAGTYTVTVTDQNGCEAVAEVVVDLMVGTGEVAGEAMLIYPNPAVDWVQITCSEPVDGNWVTLSDASGRVLRSVALARGSEAVMLDLRGLPAGAYWVMVRNRAGQELYWGKVLKF